MVTYKGDAVLSHGASNDERVVSCESVLSIVVHLYAPHTLGVALLDL
jgi:hypothetical protein